MDDYKRDNRIREALDIRNMKQIELAEKTEISRGTINNWMNQRYQPKQRALIAMSRVLDVSEMWLAGYDVPMESPAGQKRMDKVAALEKELMNNDRLTNLVSQLTLLTDSQLDTVENLINEFVKVNQITNS